MRDDTLLMEPSVTLPITQQDVIVLQAGSGVGGISAIGTQKGCVGCTPLVSTVLSSSNSAPAAAQPCAPPLCSHTRRTPSRRHPSHAPRPEIGDMRPTRHQSFFWGGKGRRGLHLSYAYWQPMLHLDLVLMLLHILPFTTQLTSAVKASSGMDVSPGASSQPRTA